MLVASVLLASHMCPVQSEGELSRAITLEQDIGWLDQIGIIGLEVGPLIRGVS